MGYVLRSRCHPVMGGEHVQGCYRRRGGLATVPDKVNRPNDALWGLVDEVSRCTVYGPWALSAAFQGLATLHGQPDRSHLFATFNCRRKAVAFLSDR